MSSSNAEHRDGPDRRNDLATRLEAALTESRQRRDEQKQARQQRRRASGLRIVDDGKIVILVAAIAVVKAAHALHRHPAIVAAGSAATAGAIALTAMLLPAINPHHDHHGALPTRPTPAPTRPTPSPQPTTPHTPSTTPNRPTTPALSLPTSPPPPPSAGASAGVPAPAIPPPISSPMASTSPDGPQCGIDVTVGDIHLRARCEHHAPAMLRPLLDAKQGVSWS